MQSLNYDELTLSFEAVDWDRWLEKDYTVSFEESDFHPDFGPPSGHTAINGPPGDPLPEAAPQDVQGMEGLDLDTVSSNIQSMETTGANFDWEAFLSQEQTELDVFKEDPLPEINPSSTATCQLAPAPTVKNAPSRVALESLSCDWPSCTRTFQTKSAYNQHYKNHTRPFKCTTCGAGRATKCHLERHINERHHAADKFYCHVRGCERSRKYFPRKDNLRRHMKQIHCLVT